MASKDTSTGRRPSLITFSFIEDPTHKLKWMWVSQHDVREALGSIEEEDLQKLGLLITFSFHFLRPKVDLCIEFILSFNEESMEGKAGDHIFRLDPQLVRDAFVLPVGGTTRPGQVRHAHISDWFPYRDDVGKRYLVRDCAYRQWCSVFQLINSVLLTRRRPKEVHGHLVLFVKSKVEGSNSDFDWAELIVENVFMEIKLIQKHLQCEKLVHNPETWLGFFLTHLMVHLNIIHEDNAEDHVPSPRHSIDIKREEPSTPQGDGAAMRLRAIEDRIRARSEEEIELIHRVEELRVRAQDLEYHIALAKAELHRIQAESDQAQQSDIFRPRLVFPEARRVKTIVLDLNGLLVRVGHNELELALSRERGYIVEPTQKQDVWFVIRPHVRQFVDECLRHFHVIFWSSCTTHDLDALLRAMESQEYLPRGVASGQVCHLFAQNACTKVKTSRETSFGNCLYLKDFSIFHTFNLSTRDVLLVDDSPQKNTTNHPFAAIHPTSFDPFTVPSEKDLYLTRILLPWLSLWSENTQITTEYVRLHRESCHSVHPIAGLRSYWQNLTADDRSLLWRSVPYAEREILYRIYWSEG